MRTRVASSAIAAALAATLGLAVVVLPALPASAKGLSQSQINSIENRLNHGKKLTYSATYTAVSAGKKMSVTIAQAPPKSLFSAGTSSIIDTGKTTYLCSPGGSGGNSGNSGSSGGGKVTCVTESGIDPLVTLEDLFSPALAVQALNEAKASLSSKAAGVHLSVSNANYAGQSATCVSGSEPGKGTGKYCVTNKGVLAYATTSSNGSSSYFQLTHYSSNPSSSLFNPPAGATTVTTPTLPKGIPTPSLPPGVTIPT